MRRSVCVPVHSPAWKHYLREGWVELWADGSWVTMVHA
jgi:hypothetical protein